MRDLAVNQFAFVSDLAGPVQFSINQGVSLSLLGDHAELAANLDNRFLPNSFRMQNGEVLAEGRRQDNILSAVVRNFPIDALALKPLEDPDLGILGGTLNADIEADLTDLDQLTVATEIEIDRPALGYITADHFGGRFRLGNGAALLTDGRLVLGQSQFLLTANAALKPELSFGSHVTVENGNLRDLLSTLQYINFEDFKRDLDEAPAYGNAADLATAPVGDPDASLPEQIEQVLAAYATYQEQQQQRRRDWLPELAELNAPFEGTIDLTFAESRGIDLGFDIAGENWSWGQYIFPNQLVARGRLDDQVLTLDSL